MIGSDDMKKKLILLIVLFISFMLVSCKEDEIIIDLEDDVYLLLMEAEDLSGMTNKTKVLIMQDGSLGLPFEYQGVTITYSSRNKDIISDLGVVTQPGSCWIESRDQQGLNTGEFDHLNDNWPVVIDVIMTYEGQTRTAKLLFVVAPRDGFTCDKYLG
jgi:hypothetical protein